MWTNLFSCRRRWGYPMGRLNARFLLWVVLAGALGSLLSFLFCCGDLDNSRQRRSGGGVVYPEGGHIPRGRRKLGVESLLYGGGEGTPRFDDSGAAVGNQPPHCDTIPCIINKEYSVSCRKEGDDVYLPFAFISQYFEVYGRLVDDSPNGVEECPRFEWSHSYSSLYPPREKYTPTGCFLWFDHYNVEAREKVKFISGIEGVPVSSQWQPDGHFYPIQIAQFALQHYCKNKTTSQPKVHLAADFDKKQGVWNVPKDGAFVQRTHDKLRKTFILNFDISNFDGLELKFSDAPMAAFILTLDIRALSQNLTFTVNLVDEKTKESYTLRYLNQPTGPPFEYTASSSTYTISLPVNNWTKFVRDLFVDMQKGKSAFMGRKFKVSKSRLKVVSVSFYGKGSLSLATLSTSAHLSMFFKAADWFIRHQDKNGAWGCTVERRLAGGSVVLPPGWYSAMGQGHAISVLTRAYHVSGDGKYLEAAKKALGPFKQDSPGAGSPVSSSPDSRGGVRAWFLGHLPWYEEYPSNPPSFVLNGFIFSLFGLYDLKAKSDEARQLFEAGLESLFRLLPLFDTGSGSVYDLRHVSLGIAPNLARWDYHTVHINQLTHLFTIIDAPILNDTAKRWTGYLVGKRASHN